jgi:hypothetical protein
MGTKKISTRTLPSGEQIKDYPDGRQVLIPGPSATAQWFDEAEDTHRWLDAEKQYHTQVRVQEKLRRMDAPNEVPSDKRPL